MDALESLRSLTAAVEKAGVDIAPGYGEYVQLAMAIATDTGEAGREYFMRLCSLSSKFDRKKANSQFTNALATHNGSVHLGSVFFLADRAGVSYEFHKFQAFRSLTHTPANNKVENELPDANEVEDEEEEQEERLVKGSEPKKRLPNMEHYEWPDPLNRIIRFGRTPQQKDVLFLGAVTALGAALERYVKCFYSSKFFSPCLQTFIVAPPASGKGVLSFIVKLVEPIHAEIRREVERKFKIYNAEKVAYDSLGKERAGKEPPQRPAERMFLISGNNTGTGILQNLMDSLATGLILEQEVITLITALASDNGHWVDVLCKSFDHDRLSYNRRTDREFREINESYLSLLVSGTPAQVKPLIPSAENGLFSRLLFYYMPAVEEWKNQFEEKTEDLNRIFLGIGNEWKNRVSKVKRMGTFFLNLTSGQKERFNKVFNELFDRSRMTNGNEMNSSVVRLAINTCRILSVVGVLRTMENGWDFSPSADTHPENKQDGIVSKWDFYISDEDFEHVMELVPVLYHHATHILSFLPSSEVIRRMNADRESFFNALDVEFNLNQAKELAKEMNLEWSRVKTWIHRLTKNKYLVRGKEDGTYIQVLRSMGFPKE